MSTKSAKRILTVISFGIIGSAIISCICFMFLSSIPLLACAISVLASIIICFFVCMIICKKNGYHINNSKSDSEVISVIAHELRSPITSIKGYLSAIKDDVIPQDKQKQYISIAIEETDRTVKTLENLMSLTKFDSDNIKISKEIFDINELIRLAIIEKLNDIEQKQITVDTEFENEREFVEADKNMIRQVIVNLTDNAIKYNNLQGKISFSSCAIDEKVKITVADNGIGISEDALPYIWQRFYQADSKSSKSYKGHGLGLCIVKEIINAHNESVDVKSISGNGTQFSFTLPRKNCTEK